MAGPSHVACRLRRRNPLREVRGCQHISEVGLFAGRGAVRFVTFGSLLGMAGAM
jgi:hypothetical protein